MAEQWNRLLTSPDSTALTPVAEQLFQQQAQGRMSNDYDLRGAWAQQGGGDLGSAHLTDTFKLPNHPTFSSGSRYATPEQPGGVWTQLPSGQWAYMPSQTNYDQGLGRTRLEDYFSRVEPNNLLLRP